MPRNLLLAATCLTLSVIAADRPSRLPVLVELFTSEGCSSCPPADRHLQRLDSDVIVLSEHVDYWNQLGWKDRFSSPEFTERQETYAKVFGIPSTYTPQMVVDGSAQFTGGDARRAIVEIDKVANRPKASIALSRIEKGVQVDIDDIPHEADVWLALADSSDTTRVPAGENKGRTLVHVSVVRSLRKVASVKRGGSFSRQISLPAGANVQRVVVFLQEAGQTRIWGVAMLDAPEI